MNKEELLEKLQGERWDTMSGAAIPKDSISLEGLADILMTLMPEDKPASQGLRKLKNGNYMYDGRMISKVRAKELGAE